jgi:threonine dehydrogenase-like Zn-dependent dehydrogenase
LFKYEVNTHTKLGDLDRFDHFVVARASREPLTRVVDESSPNARILVLDIPQLGVGPVDGEKITEHSKMIYGKGAFTRDRWKEAVRLIRDKAINLVDHSSNVLPLEQYPEASASADSGEAFKVLLSVNSDLRIL